MHVHGRLTRVTACLCNMINMTQDMFKGTILFTTDQSDCSLIMISLSDVFKLNQSHAAVGWYL